MSENIQPDKPRLPRKNRNTHAPNIRGRVSINRNTKELFSSIVYDESLPVCQHREEIRQAIDQNQVLILCGETGSGKSTQLPKILLEMGFADHGIIGHTQPRRIAAVTIATRIAEELALKNDTTTTTPPNSGNSPQATRNAVGYKIRFNDSTSADTCVKLMTDGILLAETQHDRFLNQYSVLIIDEAHERSLNIDFLLGFIKRILPRRPDLKLIITSATINAQRFAEHFGTYSSLKGLVPAPIIAVSGRTYPVEIRYCPPEEDDSDDFDDDMSSRNSHGDNNSRDDVDWQRAAVKAVSQLCREGRGDILVFMPTEYDILETAKLLRSREIELGHPDILPLYARLSSEQQHKIFQPSGRRKIVIATNVAESSITVPGIRYVVDTGTARLSRYSARTKTQRLPIEAISQASADQRAGRCGRVGPGVCVRLYSEKDYLSRDKYTTPEIQRTNLASVILQTIALKLGEIDRFPFIDPPRSAAIRDGYNTLMELGALDENRHITRLGHSLAALPTDPRIGRMILAAKDEGCLGDVLIIASVLELRDPRERPMEKAQAADAAHEKFLYPQSDFMSYIMLWDFYMHLRDTLSRSQLRKACAQNFISSNRMREWTDVYRQLRDLLNQTKSPERTGDPDKIHRALLAGLLANVGFKQASGEYLTSGGKYVLWPGSGLRKSGGVSEKLNSKSEQYSDSIPKNGLNRQRNNSNSVSKHANQNALFTSPNTIPERDKDASQKTTTPQWLIAAEMVETSKRYLRCAAKIDPDWIESMALHLVKRSYVDPHWEKSGGSAVAYENVSLFGLPIVVKRRVRYGKINPVESRQLLIQCGLVEGDLDCKLDFFQRNRALQADLERLQAKMRRHDFLYGDWKTYEFYDARIPENVYDLVTLKQWASTPGINKSLIMTESDLASEESPSGDLSRLFPDTFVGTRLQIPIEYVFHPGEENDGISIQVPAQAAHQLTQNELNWGVPGLLNQRIVALIKSLPKNLRRPLVPAPDTAAWVASQLDFGKGNFLEEVARRLNQRGGQGITPAMFNLDEIEDGLKINVQAVDADGNVTVQSRNLDTLLSELGAQTEQKLESHTDIRWTQDGLTGWTFGELPPSVQVQTGSAVIHAFPMLEDVGSGVNLRLAESMDKAQRETRRGIVRLIQIACRRDLKNQALHLPGIEQMRLNAASLRGTNGAPFNLDSALTDFIAIRALDSELDSLLPRNEEQFNTLVKKTRANIGFAVQDAAALMPSLWDAYHAAALKRDTIVGAQGLFARQDVHNQIEELFSPGFLITTPYCWLKHFPRFLKAIVMRLDALNAGALNRDQQATELIKKYWDIYLQKREGARFKGEMPEQLLQLRWLIEEFRVSLFAQKLGTSVPVSEKRLDKLIEKCI